MKLKTYAELSPERMEGESQEHYKERRKEAQKISKRAKYTEYIPNDKPAKKFR